MDRARLLVLAAAAVAMRVSADDLRLLTQRHEGVQPTARRQPVTRKEREIQTAVLEYLRTRREVCAWRSNSGAAMLPQSKRDGTGTWRPVAFGFKGLSDIIGFVAPGARFLAIEVKREGRYPTLEQQAFLEAVRAAGGIGIVAYGVDDVRRALTP